MNEKLVIQSLESWEQLNKLLPQMDEDEVQAALKVETKNARRKQLLLRLHRRYCMMRTRRERDKLMELCA